MHGDVAPSGIRGLPCHTKKGSSVRRRQFQNTRAVNPEKERTTEKGGDHKLAILKTRSIGKRFGSIGLQSVVPRLASGRVFKRCPIPPGMIGVRTQMPGYIPRKEPCMRSALPPIRPERSLRSESTSRHHLVSWSVRPRLLFWFSLPVVLSRWHPGFMESRIQQASRSSGVCLIQTTSDVADPMTGRPRKERTTPYEDCSRGKETETLGMRVWILSLMG